MRLLITLTFLLTMATPIPAADEHPVIPLWQDGAPGSNNRQNDEKIEESTGDRKFLMLTGIHQPYLTVYLPPRENASGTGIIVLPGGGHRFLAVDIEGTEIADWLNQQGIAAFVLKTRLSREPGSTYTLDDEVADMSRAIRIVRSRAAEFHIDPAKIGVTGYSAGAQTAGLASVRFDRGDPNAADPLLRVSSRPDFQILGYAAFRYQDGEVPADTPPTFLAVAQDDTRFAQFAAESFVVLTKAKVPAELHIYQKGGHGFGVRTHPTPVNNWKDTLLAWMRDIGVYTRK